MPRIEEGQVYGRLTVIQKGRLEGKNRYWICECSCGNKKEICYSSLSRGVSKSCGCLNSEMASIRAKVHGKAKSSIHNVWVSMRERCLNEKNHAYKNYGLRGISICERWMIFENFYKDMGDKPKDKTLDRIDNEKGYSKENCRWATSKEQANNRRSNRVYENNGVSQNLMKWSETSGIPYFTLRARIDQLKWDISKAVSQPLRNELKELL